MTEIIAVPQRCGTCDHEHFGLIGAEQLLTGSVPACPACGCAAFTLHPDVTAAAAAAESADAAAFTTGTRVLGGDIAQSLHTVLRTLEEQIERGGWDQAPMCGVLYLGAGPAPVDGGFAMMSVSVAPLFLSYARLLEMTGGDMSLLLFLLADMAEDHPTHFDTYRAGAGIDPADPVVGWWCTYEAWLRIGEGSARDDPSLRADEIRQLVCVDVDERVHEITRLRSTGEVSASVQPLPAYTDPAGKAAGLRQPGGGMPPTVAALLRLIRVTRSEAALRNALPPRTA